MREVVEKAREKILMDVVLTAAQKVFGTHKNVFKIVELSRTSYGYSCYLCLNAPTLTINLPGDTKAMAEAVLAYVKIHPDMRDASFKLEFLLSYARIGRLMKFSKYETGVTYSPELKGDMSKRCSKTGGKSQFTAGNF